MLQQTRRRTPTQGSWISKLQTAQALFMFSSVSGHVPSARDATLNCSSAREDGGRGQRGGGGRGGRREPRSGGTGVKEGVSPAPLSQSTSSPLSDQFTLFSLSLSLSLSLPLFLSLSLSLSLCSCPYSLSLSL